MSTIIKGRNDAAAKLGVAPASLRGWMNDPTFPDCSNGHDIAAINAWRANKQNAPQQQTQTQKLKDAAAAQKLQKAKIENEILQLKLEAAKKQYYPRLSAELALSTVFTELSDWFEQFIDVITTSSGVPKKYQKKLKERLREEINQGRHRLRDTIESTLKDLDATE